MCRHTLTPSLYVLFIDTPDAFRNDMADQNVGVGDKLSLSTCYVSVPYPNVTWFHNGIEIMHIFDPVVNIHTCSELSVANFVVSGVGNYTCRISNELGFDEVKYTVHIKGESIHGYIALFNNCLLYTSPSPRDATLSRMPSSA